MANRQALAGSGMSLDDTNPNELTFNSTVSPVSDYVVGEETKRGQIKQQNGFLMSCINDTFDEPAPQETGSREWL